MPIEAVQVELFEIDGHFHLKTDRIFPLPGADRFELSLRERETSKRKLNVRRNKPVLSLLVKEGVLKEGDRVRLLASALPGNVKADLEAVLKPEDIRLVAQVDEQSPSKLRWQPIEGEESRLVSPASLPGELACLLLGVDAASVGGIAVGENYVVLESGKSLKELALELGLWE